MQVQTKTGDLSKNFACQKTYDCKALQGEETRWMALDERAASPFLLVTIYHQMDGAASKGIAMYAKKCNGCYEVVNTAEVAAACEEYDGSAISIQHF
jgi:hypothetical protein